MYTFDLYRGDVILVCLGYFSVRDHAKAACFKCFERHGYKRENAGLRWLVRKHIYDDEGRLDRTVVVNEYVSPN